MFIHMVLFEIQKKHVPTYVADCEIWRKEVKRHAGFVDYRTLFRVNKKDHYAALFVWKTKGHNDRFMKKHHDRLVLLCQCPVKVLGYYDFTTK